MPWSDFLLVFQWWGTLFLVGAVAYPFTKHLFRNWFDQGFLFTKAVGLALVTFGVYLAGSLHLLPFTQGTIWAVMGALFLLGIPLYIRKNQEHSVRHALVLAAEELFFFAALLFWTWVKAHEPSIHNLEKYMDFGFTKSILDSTYFPPADMWYAGFPINYYYFGHMGMAVLTRLSGIDLTYTFNLMLATIFAFCFTMSFSIGKYLTKKVWGGILTAFLVTLAGNMQTIYAFTRGYTGDAVKPFWELLWPLQTFWQKLPEGLNTYWYANATRFIPYTIHEFPSYSFVVSDVHGHVLSIPFVLLAIALLISIRGEKIAKISWGSYIFYGFLCGVLLMTNALDGPIYLGLFIIIFVVSNLRSLNTHLKEYGGRIGLVIVSMILTSIPFLLHFKSFVNGLAVNCPPSVLADTKIGPILFETVEKCQHSPVWMWWLLWGFFVFCAVALFVSVRKKISSGEGLLMIFSVFSVLLLIFPEFFYFKDIYPMHFRSNTMFKLGYQAFIMLSIVSGYTIVKLFRKKLFFLLLIPQLFLISIFPIFSVRSYFDSLRNYESVFGMGWFERQYPDDWAGIVWLNQRTNGSPVIVEADGDSYTDYDRVSAFTGLPTIVGWPVHEWLWRGSYDVVAPRRAEVGEIYESKDIVLTNAILAKYHVTYIFVGYFERQKFKNLQEDKLLKIATPVFAQGETIIYRVN